ncbi:MAG: hypothetical protein JSW41_03000 [Candidatus Aenigmatarchaeota archaeon]|nr:MAG: hypothetical protein JSW41_03000 [Candidatus Aenigmarchaeota archaeon]
MKAQFFILGAILLCSLFFIGLPPGQPLVQSPLQDMDYILQNLEREFPHALNLGLEDENPRQTMEDFTSWVRGLTQNFLLNFSSFWVFAEGDPLTGNVVVSLGNYMGSDMNVNLDLDGDQRNVFVQDGDSQSTTFSSVGSSYDLSVQFGNEARSFTWQRDKVNLFALIELVRGENIARSDVVA